MNTYSLAHLGDEDLLRALSALVARERTTTASVLAHIAEVEERWLYLPAACSSMFDYCVRELHFSEDAAFKRIRAARAVRRFPEVFDALVEGRLSLTSVVLLAPRLSQGTVGPLIASAAHKTKSQIRDLIAGAAAGPELPVAVEPGASLSLATCSLVSENVGQLVPEPVSSCTTKRAALVAPPRFPLHLTMDERTREQLRYAQELLNHKLPSGDTSKVFALALDALVSQLEKRKFAAAKRPRSSARPVAGRTIPAAVKRAVWKRDGGQCTFVGDTGRRCSSRKFLEFDHVLEFALGGRATTHGLRLRCRAHNQYTAEQTFGAPFMERKREGARRAAVDRAVVRRARTATTTASEAAATEDRDVVPWLRALGFSMAESRRASALCDTMPEASLEDRVRFAIANAHRHA